MRKPVSGNNLYNSSCEDNFRTLPKCLIIGASEHCFWDGNERYDADIGYVICADGGVDNAEKLGLKVDAVIGDFDSASGGYDSYESAVLLPREKDVTDIEYCARYAVENSYRDLIFIGCTGGRQDHFLAVLFLLQSLADEGVNAEIIDSNNRIFPCCGETVLSPPHYYKYFSIIPIDAKINGVTVEGAKYPLNNAAILRGGSLGVSNEPLAGDTVYITVENGNAIIVLSN